MPSKSPLSNARRIQTRRSSVHGNGVFAVQDLAEGERIIEYKGEIITWKEALRRHPHDPAQPNHTFYFHIDDGRVIDGNVDGNAARWINHSCEPNCEADEVDGRVYIKALRNLAAHEANRMPIADAGALGPLVSLARSGASMEEKAHAAAVLRHLALHPALRQRVEEAGFAP